MENELGRLVKGDLNTAMKQHALFTLLGPSFVGRYLATTRKIDMRALERTKIQDVYRDSQRYGAG